MRIPIVRPSFHWTNTLSASIRKCLHTGQVTNNGIVQEFERQLTEYLGVPTLAFSSGQTALITMLMAAGVEAGDEVICPSFTFPATVHAIAMLGAKPVFADIHPLTLTLTIDVKKITRKTQAILGVDVYGICCDYEGIVELADNHDIYALFDSAPAFGSTVNGVPTGRFGDAQIFSFHATKPFSTMEGGALCTSNILLREAARKIRDFGQTEDRECVRIGLNGKMTEVCALIGLEQLKTWVEVSERRKERAAFFGSLLRHAGAQVPKNPPGQQPIWAYMPILVDQRDEVLQTLNENGIGARKYYQACHLMDPYVNWHAGLSVTEVVASRVIALPLLPDMTLDEMNYICEVLKGAIK
jgi:dTDP-4-amino-4,6-dideoxyglucose